MPAVTFLDDWEVRKWDNGVPGDEDLNELLFELRKLTGRQWIVMTRDLPIIKRSWHRLGYYKAGTFKHYTLYLDCHGEWQVMNLCTERDGGSNFFLSHSSREHVMNYMLGHIAGTESERRPKS